MTLNDLIALRERLDAMLQEIRAERNITPPMMWCLVCPERHRSAAPRVSLCAMILSLARFGIASAAETKQLEKRWTKYREKNGLDIYGAVTFCRPRPSGRTLDD